jgi:hypothetical protein
MLDEVNKVHERMMEVMNSSMRNSPDPVANPAEFQDFFHIEDNEDDINDNFDKVAGDSDNQTATVNQPRGVVLSWNNCVNGNLRLVPNTFVLPSMPFPNLIRMWYCGDLPKNIPPYRMLHPGDVKHLNYG